MQTKHIEQIVPSGQKHWVGDGFQVYTFFPSGEPFGDRRMSPFFLLDYGAKRQVAPSSKLRGVGVHPHRGFETVTLMYHGKGAHHDSAGNSGIIEEGDVQWMTAASGVLHKEYFEKEFNSRGGDFQMVQLWVNLPAKDKMVPPNYQAIVRYTMGKYTIPDDGGEIDIVAGELHGVKGAATTFTPIEMYNIRLNKGGKVTLSLPSDYNTGLMIVQGKVTVNDSEKAGENEFVLFQNDGENFTIHADEVSTVLLLSGQPIDEPIAAYGPFVMNTRNEIIAAYDDFDAGKFGYLED